MIPEAPKFINQRLSSLNNYTWSYFFPGNELNVWLKKIPTQLERKKEINRLRKIINEASYIVFIFLLIKFFKEGTNAAIKAVDTLKSLDIDEFQIGSQVFKGRNENVMNGDNLAQKLLDTIEDEKLVKLIKKSNYSKDIIERYRPFIDRKK
ncbi:MAG TPA: hypothetical protein DHV28_16300 [Ignavibacteriales bacterium]|nr:hypothetical protein [Ignavibacteriales bacterium]